MWSLDVVSTMARYGRYVRPHRCRSMAGSFHNVCPGALDNGLDQDKQDAVSGSVVVLSCSKTLAKLGVTGPEFISPRFVTSSAQAFA